MRSHRGGCAFSFLWQCGRVSPRAAERKEHSTCILIKVAGDDCHSARECGQTMFADVVDENDLSKSHVCIDYEKSHGGSCLDHVVYSKGNLP